MREIHPIEANSLAIGAIIHLQRVEAAEPDVVALENG